MIKMLLRFKASLRLKYHFWKYFCFFYSFYVGVRKRQIRKKDKIKVLFVLSELGAWKTEPLYLAMREHPRFDCILGITQNPIIEKTEYPLMEYLEKKGYPYVNLNERENVFNEIDPDISFYYKPYDAWFPPYLVFKRHLKTLHCFINYGFTMLGKLGYITQPICDYSWFVFVENDLVAKKKKEILGWKARNVAVTGIPTQDDLMRDISRAEDPWKDSLSRKRIIYAPHHSFKGSNGTQGIEFATFLEFGEFMQEMAEKYQDKIYISFKPHPTMYSKLLDIWGKEKTDAYYDKWGAMANSQVNFGEYAALFKYSDAMIHDCGSFLVEYLYTKKPVLYLNTGGFKVEDLNDFGKGCYAMHHVAENKAQIENFILDVIAGKNLKREERELFYKESLIPPNSKTACENIIDAILGN